MVSVGSQLCTVPIAFAQHRVSCGRDARTGQALGKEAGAKAGCLGAGPLRLSCPVVYAVHGSGFVGSGGSSQLQDKL